MKCNQLTTPFMNKKKGKNIDINCIQHNHCYDLTKQSLFHALFPTTKCDFVSDALAPTQNLHPGIGTHLPTKLGHEVLLYT